MQQISKTKIKRHLAKKTSPKIIEAVMLAKKQKAWLPIAKKIANSTRDYASVNLSDIDKKTTPGDTVLIIGKVLASGELTKKVRICSLGISKSALDKLKKTKSEYASISQEIKGNPKAEGIKIIQ